MALVLTAALLNFNSRPAARSEGPEAAVLATVRPLGPVRSWGGGVLVVRGVQLDPWAAVGSVAGDPDRHRGWLLCLSSVPAAGGRGLLRTGGWWRPGAEAARVLGS
jgi:hypothetical protein